ncbi:reverse transcriptase domain-containing protein [Streptococcus dysgalactiae]|uniref:reverse transcriptase domain-containing protein n=1 Tax=Streptococcus dysgalactiae TaxID=1334 RepID=UPI00195259BE
MEEHAHKSQAIVEVRRLSKLIKAEVKRLSFMFARQFFQSHDSKQTWKGIKLICGKKQKACCTNDIDADELNAAFIHPDNASLPTISLDQSFMIDPFAQDDVYRALRTVKYSSSVGPDRLSPMFLKLCASYITPLLTNIFNTSLQSSCIPDCWRPITVIPIPKQTHSQVVAKRYRPISLTSHGLKIAERLILQRLQLSLTTPSDPLQFAYKHERSTLDAVSCLLHFISKSLNGSTKAVRCVFLDCTSAFDRVPRSLLLQKLQSFGCPRYLLAWLTDYFTRRIQCTKIGKVVSKPLANNSGVLQGAVLSPFLFSVYLSDLQVPSPASIFKYADDIALAQPVSDFTDLASYSSNLTSIHHFASQSGLTLNPTKSFECIYSLSRSPIPLNPSSIASDPITRVTSVKYLGVTIENTLHWSTHISNTVGKVRRLSYHIRKLRQFGVPQSSVESFVYQCIFPIILYCSPVIFPGLLKKDFNLLRRGMKIINRVSFIPLDDLLKRLCSTHVENCLAFAHKILRDQTHPLHSDLVMCRSYTSTRSTYRHLSARINLYKNSIVPYLARALTNQAKVLSDIQELFRL